MVGRHVGSGVLVEMWGIPTFQFLCPCVGMNLGFETVNMSLRLSVHLQV